MDGPNNNDANGNPNGNKEIDPRNMSRGEYVRNVRAAMDERRQRAISNRQQFEPQIHQQIQRLFEHYEAPLHARLRGFGRTQTLALAESTVLSLAAVNNRSFEDSETQALTEHFLSSVHSLLVWKWAMTGMAAYMAYRGRRTWRFPFFTPEFKRFSPIGAGPGIQYLWHSARFAAYYGTLWVLGEPVFQGANFMRQRAAMEQDPRLRSLLREGKSQGATLLGGGGGGSEASEQVNDAWESAAQQEQSRGFEQDSQPAQPQVSWSNSSTPSAQSQPQEQQSRAWDSSISDGFDDASPVAASARDQQSNTSNYSGSAWDRVRQQAQYQPPNRADQKTWEKPQSGGGWGSESEAVSRQQQQQQQKQQAASQESYTFAAVDAEKNLVKDQAQREFDRLLERERGGVDQDRGPWSKR